MAAPVMNNSAGLSLYAHLAPQMALLSGRVCLHTWAFMKYLRALHCLHSKQMNLSINSCGGCCVGVCESVQACKH